MGVLSPIVAFVLSVFGMFSVPGPSLSGISSGISTELKAVTPVQKSPKAQKAQQAAGTFRNPLNAGADPTMVYFNNSYYLATTQGDRIRIWRSPSLATLLNAPGVDVWQDSDPSRNTQMWAPAMYRFETEAGPRWYIYYTASNGVDANHRMYVIESAGDDPMGPYTFKNKVFDFGQYAIDGEPFRHNGLLYFAWASPGRGQGGPAQIYVAPMNNPWTVSGQPVAVPVNGGCAEVREGPTFLYRNGRTWLTYSTCDTGKPDYQLWMTSIADGADPLVAGNWSQRNGPVFSRNDANGVWGPGHHFFFKSPDGTEDWIAYHAKNTAAYDYGWRTTRAQKFTWNADGSPNFGTPVALGADVPLPAGDPGPAPRVINDFDIGTGDFQVSYAGNWNSGTGCGNQCFRGDDHWSGAAGETATFTFTGTQIALLSVRDTGNGIAAISIDGGPEQRVDYYGTPRVGQQLNYLSPKLQPGQHKLTVRVTGEKNPASGWTAISIDRAEVWP
jgi:GH43 family beta-xylosidase